MKKLLTISNIAIFITILAFIGVFFFLKFPKYIKAHTDPEIFKLSFQFLLLVVIGGAVTLIFTSYTKLSEQKTKQKERENEKRLEYKKSQHKFHNDFVQSYNSIKLLRRLFRARARILSKDQQANETIAINTKLYDTQMQELTKLQLQFEFYIDEAKSNPNLFPDKIVNNSLQTKMKLMEGYLSELVKEHENCYKLFPNQHYITTVETIPLIDLPVLAEFIITYEDAVNFRKKFKEPADEVQKILLSLLSNVSIETYTEAYKNSVADLILSIQNGEFGIPINLNQQQDLNKISKFYQVNNGNFWIAKIGEKVIGTIALLDIGNNKGALRKMFVDKDYRGKEFGIGQYLLNNLVMWAKDKAITEIFLGTTEKFIAAQRFYEKNGFVEIKKQNLPVEFPVMEVDVKFYKFTFDKQNKQ